MHRSSSAVAYVAAIAAGVALFAIGPPGRQGGVSPVAAAAQSTSGPSAVSVSGVTLRSVDVDIPNGDRRFEGPGADVVNNNCLVCHSAGMVLTQPPCLAQSGSPRSRKCGIRTRRQSTRRTSRRLSTIWQTCLTKRGAPPDALPFRVRPRRGSRQPPSAAHIGKPVMVDPGRPR